MNVEPEVNVSVRSLPLTEMPSDDDDDVTDVAVCCADAQLRLPVATLTGVVGGGVGLIGVTGDVPPPPGVPPPPDEEVLEADVALELDVPEEPSEHPVIVRAAAIAATDVIRIVIGSAAFRNKPLVPVEC
ncbi:MAG: hypothetical protein ABSD02_17590 [Steroidobacteraceae bacterium]